jgi:hypothetical protein
VHCRSEQEAQALKAELQGRLAACGLELHPTKTKVVYLRAPAHGGHDFGMMADSISGPWRTAFLFDGGHFRGESETLSAMIPKRLGL